MDPTITAGRREWLGLALPAIARDLDASSVEQLWLTGASEMIEA